MSIIPPVTFTATIQYQLLEFRKTCQGWEESRCWAVLEQCLWVLERQHHRQGLLESESHGAP